MVAVACEKAGCWYRTPDTEGAVAAVLLTNHLRSRHPEPVHAKLKPLDGPVVGHNTTQESWHYFLSSWTAYKTGTGITTQQTPFQLLNCCEADLRHHVTRANGQLDDKPEKDILAAIQCLAVKEESLTVSRVNLFDMKQPPGVDVRTYAVSLRGQANVCDFNVTVHCDRCDVDISKNYGDKERGL